jgi:hypothetical protein
LKKKEIWKFFSFSPFFLFFLFSLFLFFFLFSSQTNQPPKTPKQKNMSEMKRTTFRRGSPEHKESVEKLKSALNIVGAKTPGDTVPAAVSLRYEINCPICAEWVCTHAVQRLMFTAKHNDGKWELVCHILSSLTLLADMDRTSREACSQMAVNWFISYLCDKVGTVPRAAPDKSAIDDLHADAAELLALIYHRCPAEFMRAMGKKQVLPIACIVLSAELDDDANYRAARIAECAMSAFTRDTDEKLVKRTFDMALARLVACGPDDILLNIGYARALAAYFKGKAWRSTSMSKDDFEKVCMMFVAPNSPMSVRTAIGEGLCYAADIESWGAEISRLASVDMLLHDIGHYAGTPLAAHAAKLLQVTCETDNGRRAMLCGDIKTGRFEQCVEFIGSAQIDIAYDLAYMLSKWRFKLTSFHWEAFVRADGIKSLARLTAYRRDSHDAVSTLLPHMVAIGPIRQKRPACDEVVAHFIVPHRELRRAVATNLGESEVTKAAKLMWGIMDSLRQSQYDIPKGTWEPPEADATAVASEWVELTGVIGPDGVLGKGAMQ